MANSGQIKQSPDYILNHDTYCWGIIGSNASYSVAEIRAGIRLKTFSLSWNKASPSKGVYDDGYLQRKKLELTQLSQSGFRVILLLGYYDVPSWVHSEYPDSYYVNQYGDRYLDNVDAGDANFIYNPAMRDLAAQYIANMFAYFGTDFAAVRSGGGRFGELTYPPSDYANRSNCYWAFDKNALSKSPTPNWRPGNPSPASEAKKFLDYYLNALVDFQNWQIQTVRKSYSGPIMMLYPSWGMRPGDDEAAINVNLNGSTSAEQNGEVQRGFDFARQINAIIDRNIVITTTWLDADNSADNLPDIRYWSPIKYLAYLANRHSPALPLFGENTGQGFRADLIQSAEQMKKYGLLGMAWYNESELFSGQYATLDDYRKIIVKYNNPFRFYLPSVLYFIR
jgi:hypothetical protein